jgi:hypothetical protein
LTVAALDSAVFGDPLAVTAKALPLSAAPGLPVGFQLGSVAFELSVSTGLNLPAPVSLEYQLTADDLSRAQGEPGRIKLATWSGSGWAPMPCSAQGATLGCAASEPGLVALVVAPAIGTLEVELENGFFFAQANGFGGAGDVGYSVVDDADAQFFAEFQRYGGVAVLGYPITDRFMHRGYLTQAFQKLVLQWRPEWGMAVPVNVLDDLSEQHSDAWMSGARQVPAPGDARADVGLAWDNVVDRHLALLHPYPELLEFYELQPAALETFGLPLSVQEYQGMIAVRLQRASLQLWTVDTPWAAAGTVVVGNAGDLAKEAGLWPLEATVPQRQASD